MKKSLFFVAAASALMLTACSSENDVVQSASQKQETAVAQALDFDVYMPQAVTRAGNPKGVMTTEKLKTLNEGFGVFAMYTGTSDYAATYKPNFMFNEHVSWRNGWTYSPLKYWPNETTQDSQTPTPATTSQLDKLSFFAYAPYVDLSSNTGTMTTTLADPPTPAVTEDAYIGGGESSGILSYSKETRNNDPLVEWKATTDLDNNVDLLWGVAPAGMDYTAVNGENVPTTFGKPLVNLVKPDKDLKIKFLFQHALSRMSISVVSAIDQIAAGDDAGKFDPNETRVLIEDVKLFGDFSTQGVLNLNNSEENVANWIQTSIVKSESNASSPLITLDQGTLNGYLSPDLRYLASQITAVGTSAANFAKLNRGVRPSESVLLSGDADASTETTDVTYAYGTVKYKKQGDDPNKSYVIVTTTESSSTAKAAYKKSGNDYIQVRAASAPALVLDGTTQYYTLTLPSVSSVSAVGTGLTPDAYYYYESGDDLLYVKAEGSYPVGNYYLATGVEPATVTGANYDAGTYYTRLIPRYFMFAPSKSGEKTNIGVKITYRVITKDEKLDGNVSDIRNIVTKSIPLTMESGKSYNLKLILGLTSVKLDAVVGEWQVGDDAEVWLPQNVE